MSAGTIKVTNGSAAVTGTSTTFQTDFKQGDIVYFEINGTPWNLIVASVESNTALTLVDKYSGPTAVSLPYERVKASMIGKISQLVAGKISLALGNSEVALNNFQQLLTQPGDVTITALNGQQFTGASWLKITKLANDADLTSFTALANTINAQYKQVDTWQGQVSANATAAAKSATDAAGYASQAAGSAQTAITKAQEAAASASAGKASETNAKTSELNAAQYDSSRAIVNRGVIPDSESINYYGAARRGVWLKSTQNGVTLANGYPVTDGVGILEVFDGGWNGVTQRYTSFTADGANNKAVAREYVRCLTGAWNGSGPWGPWMRNNYANGNNEWEHDGKIRAYGNNSGSASCFEWQATDRATTINATMATDGAALNWNYSGKMAAMNFNNLQLLNVGFLKLTGTIESQSIWGWGNVTARSSGQSSQQGTYNNTPSVKAMFWGRGGYGDPNGAYVGLYFQEYVGSYHQAILNLNGFDRDRNWMFRADGNIYTPLGTVAVNGSDVRLKDDIVPAAAGAGARIDLLGAVEYTEKDTGRRRRGFISQQADTVDPVYTSMGGENVDEGGNKYEILNIDDRAIMADLVATLQEARATIRNLESRLAALEGK